MDNTAKETWIDKLIDELVDTKDEVSQLRLKEARLETLISLIFNNVRLDYDGKSLRFDNETAILEYLRVIYSRYYEGKLTSLKTEREAEVQRLEEAKAKEAKGKKEA